MLLFFQPKFFSNNINKNFSPKLLFTVWLRYFIEVYPMGSRVVRGGSNPQTRPPRGAANFFLSVIWYIYILEVTVRGDGQNRHCPQALKSLSTRLLIGKACNRVLFCYASLILGWCFDNNCQGDWTNQVTIYLHFMLIFFFSLYK